MSLDNFGKCSICGCTGIHACLGNNSKLKTVDMKNYSKYNNIKDAINHIRMSEKQSKSDHHKGQKNDKYSGGR